MEIIFAKDSGEPFRPFKWLEELWYLIDRGIYRVGHILAWLPVLWDDHDWDHGYFYRIMRYKIHRMRQHFEKVSHIPDAPSIVRELMVAENLLTRLIDDDYMGWRYEEIRNKYPQRKPFFDPDRGLWVIPDGSKDPDAPLIRECGRRAVILRKLDQDALYNLLKRKGDTWWD